MQVASLTLQDFRSIELLNLSFDSPINIILGENNAGKTTFLEAIYFCSNLKSFKSVPSSELIHTESNSFKISLNFINKQLNSNIFIEKTLKSSKVLYNNKRTTKQDLMLAFPCYSLVFGFNNILLNDSSYRREFLDSGMFHVEPNSYKSLQSYDRCLKQRNFLLRAKRYDEIPLWDQKLIECNNQLSESRRQYFDKLNTEFQQIITDIQSLTPEIYSDVSTLKLRFEKGWDSDNFESELKSCNDKDRSIGYTTRGTHRCDFVVVSNGRPVKESGSMSTLVLACLIMNLARINVFHVKHGFKPILLIDDLFFGIDNKNLSTVVKLLIHSQGNIVLTAPNIYRDILEKISQENGDIELKELGKT